MKKRKIFRSRVSIALAWIICFAMIFAMSSVSAFANESGEGETGTISYEPLEIATESLNGNAIRGVNEDQNASAMDNWGHFYSESINAAGGLPNNGKITMTSGVPYILAAGESETAYDGNDCIRLTARNTEQSMVLGTLGVYENIYVLATAGGPGTGHYADFKVTLTYTEGDSVETTYKLYDWYDLTTVPNVEKYTNIKRIPNGTNSTDGSTTAGPVLHSATIKVDTTRLLKQITFTMNGKDGNANNMSDLYCCIFAVTGATPAGVPEAPVASQVMKVEGSTTGAFTANWNPVIGATSYVIDVAKDRKFTDILTDYNNLSIGDVTQFDVDGSAIDPNVTYYYRVRAVNDKGQSLSSNRVATDIPIWIKDALYDEDYDKVSYDAETNTIIFKENVALKDTIVLPAEDKTVIDLCGQTVTAPEGKSAVSAGSGNNVELSIISTNDAGSTGQTGTIVGNGTDESGNGAAVIDFSNASGNSAITVTESKVSAGSGSNSESGNGGNGGTGIAAGSNTKIEVGTGSTITGGDGGNGTTGNGGNGGTGISGGNVTIDANGNVSGGNGGDALNGTGGTGGSGVFSEKVTNSGNVAGGNGGDGSSGGGTCGTAGAPNGTDGTAGNTHTHIWSYEAKDNIIYVWCTQEEGKKCGISGSSETHENALTLTLTAPDASFTGSSYQDADVEDKISPVVGGISVTTGSIQYYKKGEDTALASAPADVGQYIAKVSIGGVTASKEFIISAIDATYTAPTANTLTYNGIAQSLVSGGTATGGEMYYRLGIDGTWSTTVPTAANAGNYDVYYYVKGDANHNSIGSEDSPIDSVKVTIGQKTLTEAMVAIGFTEKEYTGSQLAPDVTVSDKSGDLELITENDYTISGTTGTTEIGNYTITVTGKGNYSGTIQRNWSIKGLNFTASDISAENVTKTYDGQSYGISVSVTKPDVQNVVVTYKDAAGEYTLTECPTYSDAAAAPYTIDYKVCAKGYYDFYGSATVTINQREAELEWGSTSLTYNGTEQKPTVNVKNLCGNDTCTVILGAGKTDSNEVAGEERYSITVTGLSNSNYKLPSAAEQLTKTYTIAQKEVGINWSNTEFTYDGQAHKPTAALTGVLPNETCNVTVTSEQTDAGEDYTATASIDNDNYKIKTSDEFAAFVINPKEITGDMISLDNTEKIYAFTNTAITPIVTVKDGGAELTSGETGDYILSGDLTSTAYGRYEITVTGKGNYTGTSKVVWSITDPNAPTGNISITTDSWKEFLSNITFGRFFKETKTVTITAEDGAGESGVDKVYYYKSGEALTLEQILALSDSEWTELGNGGSFSISPDAKLVIYAKLTDKSGNITYISSDGLVLDATSPAIVGVKDSRTYCSEQTITVTDTNLDKVTVNGTEVSLTDGSYTFPADGSTYAIAAADKAGNITTVTVTVKNGHTWKAPVFTWSEDYSSATATFTCANDSTHVETKNCEATENTTEPTCTEAGKTVYTATVTFNGEKYADTKEEVLAAPGHDWSGEWTVVKEATAIEDGKRETYCTRGCGQKKVEVIPAIGSADEGDTAGGTLQKDTEVAPEAPVKEATLDNKKSELLNASNIFNEEEKSAIENGQDARVWLEVTRTDVSSIEPVDKAEVEKVAEEIMGENPAITYFDADLFKQVGDGEKTTLHEPGIDIKVTIKIPEELLNHDRSMIREYKIIRLHYDTATGVSSVELLGGSFNAVTGEFTFATDKFSTYAIAYNDIPVEDYNIQHVTGITLSQGSVVLTGAGETLQLTATVAPENATDKGMSWLSSDTSVATVDANGKVTAVGSGTCAIIATTNDGYHSVTCTVTVNIQAGNGGNNGDGQITAPSTGRETVLPISVTVIIFMVLALTGVTVALSRHRKRTVR